MKTAWIMVVILGCVASLYAQPGPDTLWTRTYGWSGNDTAFGLQQTFDGGFILAGTATIPVDPPHTDVFTIKTDGQGSMQGWRSYGGPGNQGAYDVVQLYDGGYAMAGYDALYGGGCFLRVNAIGDTVWTDHRFPLDCEDQLRATSVKQAVADGDTLLAASAMGHEMFGNENCVCLFTLSLEEGSGANRCTGTDLPFTANDILPGNEVYYQVGMQADVSGSRAACVRHIPFDLSTWWITRYGGAPFEDEAFGIIAVPGGFVLAGATTDGHDDGIFLCKITANGDLVWLQRYTGEYAGTAHAVVPAIGGGFVIAGTCPSYLGGFDMYLVKFNSNGGREWHRNYGGPGDERAYDLVQTPDGGFVLVGYTDSWGSGGTDWYVVKTQPDPQLSAAPVADPLPSDYRIAAYPNPFNPSTVIVYALPQSGHVLLRVFDLLGREVAVLKDGVVQAGTHRVMFDGSGLASGIYFARLDAGTFSQTMKLVLLK